ncbi:hypothetical protein ACO1O0_009136 [Amphichorda felina]
MSTTDADLVIVGATPAGITTAIAAARLSKTSIIVERTSFIGGLPANGLGATDIATRGATGGLFLEFVARIKAHYVAQYGPDSPQVRDCDDGYHFEPSVAEAIFHQWLHEFPDITILRERQFDFEPENVAKQGDRITSIRVTNLATDQPETITGRFFVDCTYEGDLIAAAGVPFFLGREGREVYGEIGAGRVYKLWNGHECPGSTGAGDNAVQAYNYRLCMTCDAANRAPVRRPANYNREEYASLVYDVKSGLHTGVWPPISDEQVEENLRRAELNLRPEPDKLGGIRRLLSSVTLPNGKVDGNNQHNAFISTDLPEENWPYPTSGWAWRDRFARRLREYTEGLMYFAQNDDELPAWFRDECSQWGWAADEYVENGHFPRQIYVREGRRMRGKYIFTANDVCSVRPPGHVGDGGAAAGPRGGAAAGPGGEDNNGTATTTAAAEPPLVHRTSITASHYALDSHAVRRREPGRAHLEGFFSYNCAPYSVPYGVMVPDAALENLLAPVPVSATHVGFSTLRMEPAWMALGQAAGTAAALCLEDGVPAEGVDVERLQGLLLDQGAVLVYDARLWEDGVGVGERKAMQMEMLARSGR